MSLDLVSLVISGVGSLAAVLGLRKESTTSVSATAESTGPAFAAGRDVNLFNQTTRVQRPATVDRLLKLAKDFDSKVGSLGARPPIRVLKRGRFNEAKALFGETYRLRDAVWEHCTVESAEKFEDALRAVEGSLDLLERRLVNHGGETMEVDPEFPYTGAFLNVVNATAKHAGSRMLAAARDLELKPLA